MRFASFCALLVFTSCAFAQTTAATPSFVVATIKPAAPPTMAMGRGGGMMMGMRMGARGGPGTSDPGQITYSSMSIKSLLVSAYGVKEYQVTGPAWMDTERFDIVAKVPQGATKDDVKLMLQNLLAERFKLTLHREKKDMQMYALVVAKNGPKLKESPPDDPNAAAATAHGEPDAPPPGANRTQIKDGAMMGGPMPGGGVRMMMQPGRMRLMADKQTMEQFAERLSNQVNRPVVDQTGLTKKYDIVLEFSPEGLGNFGPKGMPPPPPPMGGDGGSPEPEVQNAPTLFTAVQDQLGLKLEQKKGAVDLLVVDRLEKTPTEN
jgi:uncharacterized protein (TIGR03435 family)